LKESTSKNFILVDQLQWRMEKYQHYQPYKGYI
jgi:hypothetical protein